jgi:hypothetical protein
VLRAFSVLAAGGLAPAKDRWQHIRIDKAFPLVSLADFDIDGSIEHRSIESEGVKLSPLAAWIYLGRKINQELLVESASGKTGGQLSWINASNDGAQAI